MPKNSPSPDIAVESTSETAIVNLNSTVNNYNSKQYSTTATIFIIRQVHCHIIVSSFWGLISVSSDCGWQLTADTVPTRAGFWFLGHELIVGPTMTSDDIATFAIMDIQTTGLNSPNITELCIYAISRNAIIASRQLPRVVHKFNLFFCPQKSVEQETAELTGLDNKLLDDQSEFDKNAGKALVSFLKHLPKPLGIVAHNGHKYSFPILRQKIQKTGVTIPPNILSVDTVPLLHSFTSTSDGFGYYTLDKVYQHLFPDTEIRKTQEAESSVVMLTELILNVGESFLNYAKRTALKF